MKALKDLENGLPNEDVPAKCDVPRNAISTRVKNKYKLTALLEKKEMNCSRKNKRCGNYEKVDKSIYNWFVGEKSQKNTYIVETFLNKERTEGLKQNHLTDFFQVVN